ncbi:DUF1659 domain-containing protein [Lysinibacillus fusiformis]|uniref:DUF1659 domain-containing protein n=1 Tax=Lysinibacillus fusiformis TaxID=28031 RepID=UPI001E56C92A|nr:DUF1659 domain-containing protein [Lysinibacillus fusiformis]MCE4043035.1 DUF1659 domain-containing protein [Lysinibacillus fusiformis]
MANVNFLHATLRLKYVEGYNDQNEPTYITKSYRNLTKTHSVDDLVTVAHAMASLSSQAMVSIEKQETSELS